MRVASGAAVVAAVHIQERSASPHCRCCLHQAWDDGHAAVLAKIQQGIGMEKPLIANHATTLATANSAQLETFFQGKTGGVDGIQALLECTANSKLCEAHFFGSETPLVNMSAR